MIDNATALREAATVSFEELGLLCVGAPVELPSDPAALPAAVCVTFTGPRSGRLTLRVCDNIFRALAENMLGLEGPDAAPWRWDALGEMANVICGNVLPRLLGPDSQFTLSPPAPGGPTQYAVTSTQVEVEVEVGRARVVLELSGPHPALW
ncbi:MAG TPA: chemotaxis protein CheX [Gemmatimonadaceae bacterium]|jgi:CheY-specific phosphatase CheX